MTRSRPRSGGFTLVEILICLALLIVFIEASGRLFDRALQSSFDARQFDNQATRADAAIDRLRSDVWQSSEITCPEPRTATLTLADGTRVIWRLDSTGALQRTDPVSQFRWDLSRPDWRFSADALTLSVLITDRPESRELRLPSQLLLANRRPS